MTFTNCNIHNNQASWVSALAPFGSSNAPMEAVELTLLLVSRLSALLTGMGALHGLCALPTPRWNRSTDMTARLAPCGCFALIDEQYVRASGELERHVRSNAGSTLGDSIGARLDGALTAQRASSV